MEVLTTYTPMMDVPRFNFYYEADAVHNPNRSVVWTDVYVDPAGQGWMASAIQPVYSGDFLEGVNGLDITVATLVDQVLALQIPWAGYGVLVSRSGTIMALPRGGEADFGLTELLTHDYQEAIKQDTFKPDEFNLFKRKDLGELGRMLERDAQGTVGTNLAGAGKTVSWNTVQATGWKLLIVVSDAEIESQAVSLSYRISTLLYIMIGGIVVFYVGFFLYLYYKAKRMSQDIAQPLTEINDTVRSIGQGNYEQVAKPVAVIELDETSRGVVEMGRRLGEEKAALLRTQDELTMAKEGAESAAKAKTEFLATMRWASIEQGAL